MTYIDENWLLQNDVGRRLYHDTAKHLPVIDYHNHLSPKEIYEDRQFSSISEMWLEGDHYKWRAMRTAGIEEVNITGESSAWAKFSAWADTVPTLLGNPLYHWTHLELNRYFNEKSLLNRQTKESIFHHTNEKIANRTVTPRSIMKQENVAFLGTTDDPTDSLIFHKKLNEEAKFTTAPSFRPDAVMKTDDPEAFMLWIAKLEASLKKEVKSLNDLLDGLSTRIDYFNNFGCRSADHGLAQIPSVQINSKKAESLFQQLQSREELSAEEQEGFRLFMFTFLAEEYKRVGWVMQLHLGPLRNTNSSLLSSIGPDAGGDSIRNDLSSEGLHYFLNVLNQSDSLPKTILYSLNSNDYSILAAAAGSFQTSEVEGKVQVGSAWWFNDHIDGIQKHLNTVAAIGSIYSFVGMLTDSRSVLSMSRHDFFRRILCNELGVWVNSGKAPNDEKLLQDYVTRISYENAANYFHIENNRKGDSKHADELSMVRKR